MSGTKEVILIAGNMGNGKTTLANFLLKAVPDSRKDSYAAPLKKIAELMLGIPLALCNAPNHIRETTFYYGRSIRQNLQFLGTEVGRELFHSDIWLHRFGDRVQNSLESITINDDTRYLNEIQGLKTYLKDKANVRAVRIRNSRVKVDLSHPSESEIAGLPDDLFDYVVANEGSLEDLEAIAGSLARLWKLAPSNNVVVNHG